MSNIYRKVMVADRLPKENGFFITDIGFISFFNGSFGFDSQNEFGVTFESTSLPIRYWMEPIELPTQEEIEIDCLELPYSDDMSPNDLSIQGANYILNKIK